MAVGNICATCRSGEYKDSTWDQDRVLALSECSCGRQDEGLSNSTDGRQHRDRLSVMVPAADDVEADAILVLLPKRPPPPRSKFARASRLVQHRDPASPPHPGATGDASQLREVGCLCYGRGGEGSEAAVWGAR